MAEYQLNVKLNGVETAVSTVGELEDALKATRAELQNVGKGSQEFDNLSRQARTLQNELKDVRESLNFDKNINNLSESVGRLAGTVTSGFVIATSAAKLFGDESSDAAKAAAEAQEILAIALAATTIATNAQKLAQDAKNVVDKIGVLTTTVMTALVGEEAIAKSANAAATGTATTAQLALNAAMKAAPYALVIGVIATFVSLLGDSGDAAKEASAATESLSKSVDELNKSYSEFISYQNTVFDAIEKYKTTVGGLTQEYEDYLYFYAQAAGLNADEVKSLEERGNGILKFTVQLRSLQSQTEQLTQKSDEAFKSLNEIANQNYDERNLSQLEDYIDELERRNKVEGELDDLDQARLDNAKLVLKIQDEIYASKTRETLAQLQLNQAEADAIKQKEKDREEAFKKEKERQDAINKIIKDAGKDAIAAQKELEFQKEEIAAEEIKNLEEREKKKEEISLKRTLYQIQLENDKAVEELKVKKASEEQILNLNSEFDKRREAAKAESAANLTAIDKKYAEDRKEIEKILEQEISFGDFNLIDRRKKLELEGQVFYNDLQQKKLQLDLASGQLTLAATRANLEEQYNLQLQQVQKERELKQEEIAFQEQRDIENAQKQLEQGVLTKQQYEAVIGEIEENARQQRIQAEADELQQRAELQQNYSNTVKAMRDDEAQYSLQIASTSTKALQGLSDLYFAIKMANVKKGSEEEKKAAEKQFKINKALAITSTVISTIQGVMNALSAQSVIPEPYGTILKVANAVAVGIAGAANVAKIAATQFQSTGGGGATTPSAPPTGGGGDTGGASTLVNAASGGGFTGFTPNLTNQGGSTPGSTPTGSGPQRVYVVESDITDTQNRVRSYESNATF